jgi:hypothetical protein
MMSNKTEENYSYIERRNTPRMKAGYKIKISNDDQGRTFDINETGACISSSKAIDLKNVSIEIILPSKAITLKASPVWTQRNTENGKFTHGIKFINATEDVLFLIRKSLVYKQLRFVIKNVKDKKAKKEIVKFSKFFKQYLLDLFALTSDIEKKKVSLNDAYNKLSILTNGIMKRGDALDVSINNRMLMKKLKQDFRTLVGCWAYKSLIVKRSFDKPRGYPGDHIVIETIYDKKAFSEGIGWCFDQYFQHNEYACAIRSRKDKMGEFLEDFIMKSDKKNINVLNIACGSNREIKELASRDSSIFLNKTVQFNLLDHDEEALEYCKEHLPIVPNATYYKEAQGI